MDEITPQRRAYLTSKYPRSWEAKEQFIRNLEPLWDKPKCELQANFAECLDPIMQEMLLMEREISQLKRNLTGKRRSRITVNDKKRFEKWAREQHPPLDLDRSGNKYISWTTELAYQAWASAAKSMNRSPKQPKKGN